MYTPVAQRKPSETPSEVTGYVPVSKRISETQPSNSGGLLTSFDAPIVSEESSQKVQPFGDTLKTLGGGLKTFTQEVVRQPASLGVEVSRRLPRGTESFDPEQMPSFLKPVSKALFGERPVPSLKTRIEDATPTFERLGFSKDSAKALSTVFIGGLTALDFTPFGGEKSVAKLLQATTKVDNASKILRTIGVAEDLVLPMAQKFATLNKIEDVEAGLESLTKLSKTTNYTPVAQRVAPKSAPGEAIVSKVDTITLYRAAPEFPSDKFSKGTYFADEADKARYYSESHYNGNPSDIKVQQFTVPKDAVFKEPSTGNYILKGEVPVKQAVIESPLAQEAKKYGSSELDSLVAQKSIELNTIKQTLDVHPAKPLIKYVSQQTGELPEVLGAVRQGSGARSKFGISGDDIVTEFGFNSAEEANQSVQGYRSLLKARDTVEADLKSLNQTAKTVKENTKLSDDFLKSISKEIQQKLAKKAPLIRQAERFEKKIDKINTTKDVLDNRRAFIHSVQKQFGLSDNDLKLITRQDIRLMNNIQFKDFLDNLRVKAEQLANRRFQFNRVEDIIKTKELQKTENLQKALKLSTIQNMTEKQLSEFADTLEQFKQGDEFLSVRKLETVDNTDLKGIRTLREAKERLAKELGRPIEDLDKIKVGAFDRFRYDTALAEKNPFYGLMVDSTNKALLNAGARYIKIEDEINKLINSARKARPRGLIERIIPQDKAIFKYLESTPETKKVLAREMTEEELKASKFIQDRYIEMRDYLIQHETLKKYRENYITHIKRGFLEQWKEDGLLSAFKNVFKQYQDEQAVFNIIDDTGQILPLEKFFQFSMKRTGGLKPTENVASAFLNYTKAFEKKVALDSIVPKLDIYAHSLTPKVMTPRGLEFDRSLKNFVNEWLNTKKGRTAKIVGVEQGGKIDLLLRAAKAFTTILDLGLNVPVGLSAKVGENMTNFISLGAKKYSNGLIRARTGQGKKIIEEYKSFVGKTPFEELSNAEDGLLGKAGKVLFGLFQDASTRANKTFLLGSLTDEEFKTGIIAGERLAELKRELGRWRVVEGAKSIFGSTSVGSTLTQYKSWAIPPLRTTADDISKMIKNKDFKGKEAQELLRGILGTLSVVFLVKSFVGDEEDKSFIGTIINKAYRDAMTLVGALDPKTITSEPRLITFLSDLGEALSQIIKLEEYSENGEKAGELKGPESLERTLTPRAVKQFIPEEESQPKSTSPKTPEGLPELPSLNKSLPPLPKLPKI